MLTKALDCLNDVTGPSHTGLLVVSLSSWTAACLVKDPTGKGQNFLDPWDVVGLRTTAGVWNVPAKFGLDGELFFFIIMKEPFRPHKGGGMQALRHCGDIENLCFDRFAHDC